MSSTTPDESDPAARALACGRDPVEVVDRARAGRSTAHERGCPYCRAAVEGDSLARTAASELARDEHAHPVPVTLLPNVMRSVWSDLRLTTMIPLTTDAGSAFVADHVVAAVIENALDRLTDLQIHTCTAHLTTGTATQAAPGADAERPATIAIEVTAAAAYNADVRAVAARARDLARDVVAQQFGWTAEPIDIEIVDVYVSGGTAR